jgi:hypothetical protein
MSSGQTMSRTIDISQLRASMTICSRPPERGPMVKPTTAAPLGAADA